MAAAVGRLRYSRDELLALKEASACIELPLNPVPLKASRPNRKKSQSSETDGISVPENGHMGSDGHNGNRRQRLWHQNTGRGHAPHQHQSSNVPFHHRQRYPSGPHGDTGESDASGAFRPVNNWSSRGSQRVWSTGCAGWRQRSYSGSEGFGVITEQTYTRGRTVGFNGSSDGDFSSRGRGFARQRGAFTGSRRPISLAHSSNAASSSGRVHSKSWSIDPPPGFELPTPEAPSASHQDNTADRPTDEDVPDTQWYYIDTSGQMQGPFGNEQMATWLTKGYLPLHIEVRRECDECFLPLLNHLALAGRIPFWKGYTQSPVTKSNLASILVTSGSPVSAPLWMNHSVPPNSSVSTVSDTTTSVEAPLPSVLESGPDVMSLQQSDQLATLPEAQDTTQLESSANQLPDSSSNHVLNNNEIMRLCNEAQALAIHAAKVEAERQELAERLNAISSTAAKLLATSPSHSDPKDLNPPAQASFPSELISEDNKLKSTTHLGIASEVKPEGHCRNESPLPSSMEQSMPSHKPEHHVADIEEGDQSFVDNTDVKKNKKKNKKSKKVKLTQEQERQQAWDAEFERRKAIALQKKLAEEEEQKRLKAEEIAALAAEQAAIAKEQKRLLKEKQQQEFQRAKTEREMAQLKLPNSARWGVLASSGSRDTPVGLADIQVAQELEEAERSRQRTLAQQAVLSTDAEKRRVTERPVNAWASVVGGNNRPVGHTAETPSVRSTASVVSEQPAPNSKSAKQMPKHVEQTNRAATQTSKTSTAKASNHPSAQQKKPPPSSEPSIWDLPSTDKSASGSKNKNAKKNKKKNNARGDETKSSAAKEQLAHWCESQLSSMPLSGVDLPTLVDLLCELETADQVVECIETSLGRSTQTSKFSKAFLEKRACILTGLL